MSDVHDRAVDTPINSSAPVVRSSRPRRSFMLRFGFRSLLIVAILFCATFAWVGRGMVRVRQEDAAIEAIQRAGTIILEPIPGSNEAVNLLDVEEPENRLSDQLLRAIGWTDRPAIKFVAIESWETDARARDAAVAALSILPEIRELSLVGVEFDDSTVAKLGRMPRLESITLAHTEISGEGLSKLRSPERIRELCLTGRNGHDVLSGLRTLTRLRDLTLGYRKLTRDDVAAISALAALERLDLLTVTPVERNVYAPLVAARSLRELSVVAPDARGFDEGDLQAISESPHLRELLLDGLTEANLAAFEVPAGLRVFTMSNGLEPAAARTFAAQADMPEEAVQRFSAEHPQCEVRCIQDDGIRRRYFFLEGEPIDPPAEWE